MQSKVLILINYYSGVGTDVSAASCVKRELNYWQLCSIAHSINLHFIVVCVPFVHRRADTEEEAAGGLRETIFSVK